MRMSACGLASTIAVAIDQILRLAPSISGPIEPVVSSTKATSTTGLDAGLKLGASGDATAAVVMASNAAKLAGSTARSRLAIMRNPPEKNPDAAMIGRVRGCPWPGLRPGIGGFRPDLDRSMKRCWLPPKSVAMLFRLRHGAKTAT